jgi:hypothetical protein
MTSSPLSLPHLNEAASHFRGHHLAEGWQVGSDLGPSLDAHAGIRRSGYGLKSYHREFPFLVAPLDKSDYGSQHRAAILFLEHCDQALDEFVRRNQSLDRRQEPSSFLRRTGRGYSQKPRRDSSGGRRRSPPLVPRWKLFSPHLDSPNSQTKSKSAETNKEVLT